MTGNRELFFSLLKAGLGWGEIDLKGFPITAGEWRAVWLAAQKQTVCGYIFAGIEKLPAEMQPPKEMMMQMLTFTERIKKSNLKMQATAGEITGWFEAEGLRPTIIKGITAGALYDRPELRMPGDIDMFFPEGYEKAVPIVRSKGVEVTLNPKHDTFTYNGIHVELHHTAFRTFKSTENIDFSPILPEYGSYRGRVLNIKANALLMILHPAKHFMYVGVGLRHLCDWAMFLKRYEEYPEMEEAWKEVKRQGAERFAIEFTAIAVHYLGLELKCPDKWIGKSKAAMRDKMMDMIIGQGNFGHGTRTKKRLLLYYINYFAYLGRAFPYWKGFFWKNTSKMVCHKLKLIIKEGKL